MLIPQTLKQWVGIFEAVDPKEVNDSAQVKEIKDDGLVEDVGLTWMVICLAVQM